MGSSRNAGSLPVDRVLRVLLTIYLSPVILVVLAIGHVAAIASRLGISAGVGPHLAPAPRGVAAAPIASSRAPVPAHELG
jgi:hypothetical protein